LKRRSQEDKIKPVLVVATVYMDMETREGEGRSDWILRR
jgi:hypothetical protein